MEAVTTANHMTSHFLSSFNKEPKYFEVHVDKIKLKSAAMQLG